ncbi:MAG: UDP-N-acetylmuramate dehydrogenase, partial [Bacteroidota bacterium]|nr:UDP-N-acetylmuramate dehydrogenase [Bacteroidota bacterium]
MQIRENYSLKPYNTFGIDVKAKYFSGFQSVDELKEILTSQFSILNFQLILGGGSNLLFTKDVDGIVLKNEIKGIAIIDEDNDFVYVKAGAGINWHEFVLYCLHNNYAGVENLSLIPGNVGASPMQNIGAYGVEIKDVFHQLEAYHINEKILKTFSLEDCEFGYRESVFKRKYKNEFVITSVSFRLRKTPVFNTSYGVIQQELDKMAVKELSIQVISKAVINIRSSKLPDWKKLGNAGSFFKNPLIAQHEFYELKRMYSNIPGYIIDEKFTKLAAGWLIEQCGWKGYRKGDAGCYAKQALVLVNYGNATGR